MIVRSCVICYKQFTTYASKVVAGKGKYCSRSCSDSITLIKKGQHLSPATEIKKGQLPWNAKGFRYTISRRGGKPYRLIYMPNHPFATKSGYMREHRLIVESGLGRYLLPDEIVDHIDGDTLNNRSENLRLMLKKEHDRMNTVLNIHRRWQKGGKPHAKGQ